MPNGIEAISLTSDRGTKKELRDELALCLSGGSYQAMLFHLGVLWYLNDAKYLPKLDRLSSVSGGSLTAGVLAITTSSLSFDAKGGLELATTPTRLSELKPDLQNRIINYGLRDGRACHPHAPRPAAFAPSRFPAAGGV